MPVSIPLPTGMGEQSGGASATVCVKCVNTLTKGEGSVTVGKVFAPTAIPTSMQVWYPGDPGLMPGGVTVLSILLHCK